LEYRLARSEDYISMRIINPTDASIVLSGSRSYAVDPHGETHPIHGRAIAPHSHVMVSIPPVQTVYSSGSDGGWGMGFGFYDPLLLHGRFGHPYIAPYGFYDPFFNGPAYSYRTVTPFDWFWKEGEVRLNLEYERAGTNFAHPFVFEKRKVK
jgi:hypothetical protein